MARTSVGVQFLRRQAADRHLADHASVGRRQACPDRPASLDCGGSGERHEIQVRGRADRLPGRHAAVTPHAQQRLAQLDTQCPHRDLHDSRERWPDVGHFDPGGDAPVRPHTFGGITHGRSVLATAGQGALQMLGDHVGHDLAEGGQ